MITQHIISTKYLQKKKKHKKEEKSQFGMFAMIAITFCLFFVFVCVAYTFIFYLLYVSFFFMSWTCQIYFERYKFTCQKWWIFVLFLLFAVIWFYSHLLFVMFCLCLCLAAEFNRVIVIFLIRVVCQYLFDILWFLTVFAC